MSLTHFMSEMNEKIFLLSFIISIPSLFALSTKFIEMNVWNKKIEMLDAICYESCVRLNLIDVIFWWRLRKINKYWWKNGELSGQCYAPWLTVERIWQNLGRFKSEIKNKRIFWTWQICGGFFELDRFLEYFFCQISMRILSEMV